MSKRRLTIHDDPDPSVPATAPRDAVAVEFARRLQQLMDKKGYNQSDLARAATKFMPEGKVIGRDTISLYMNARNLPRSERLDAICQALGVEKKDLLPTRGITASAKITPPLDVREMDNGTVWLRVNQAVTWPVAIKVMELIKGENAASDQ